MTQPYIAMTNFALRHFPKESDSKSAGTKITDITSKEFVENLNRSFNSNGDAIEGQHPVICVENGYADFCKIAVSNNFTNARTGTLPIDLANYRYLRSGYSSRREGELEVLTRWFDLPVAPPKAKYLRVVLYSKDQLEKEHVEQEEGLFQDAFDVNASWGVVAVLGQLEITEEPMSPMTMMRNSLGMKEGGSGKEIDREAYKKAVEFWDTHALVK